MNPICNYCCHQRADGKGDVKCSIAEYRGDSYGSFKMGSVCIYDGDLEDRFLPKDEASGNELKLLARRVDELQTELVSLRHENSVLKERLTKVRGEGVIKHGLFYY